MSGPRNWLRVPLPEVSLGPRVISLGGEEETLAAATALGQGHQCDNFTVDAVLSWKEATSTQSESPGLL